MKKNYVVTVGGAIAVDTTVAVIAASEPEARCLALHLWGEHIVRKSRAGTPTVERGVRDSGARAFLR